MTHQATPFRGLLWNDWRRHRLGVVAALVAMAFVELLVSIQAPGTFWTFLGMFGAMAFTIGLGFGRAEWGLGEEEFMLALPATRPQRYDARLLLAGAVVAAMAVLALIGSFTTWPADLWDWCSLPALASGPDPDAGDLTLSFGVALTAPIAAFASSFAVSMSASGRSDVGWIPEYLALALLGAGLYELDAALLGAHAGWLFAAVALGFAALRLRRGRAAYAARDAVFEAGAPETTAAPRMLLLALVLLTGLLVLATFLYLESSRG